MLVKEGDHFAVNNLYIKKYDKYNVEQLKDVVIKNASFDYSFLLGDSFISIDSTSTMTLNKIKLRPYISYDTEKDTVYTLKVDIPKMKAQDFIVSLPDGLFTHFQGIIL